MARLGRGFSAATQFDICGIPEPFLRQSIEIGRGCIHKDRRNGRALFLLGEDLIASLLYMNKTTLFGCCSVFTHLNNLDHMPLSDSLEKGWGEPGEKNKLSKHCSIDYTFLDSH